MRFWTSLGGTIWRLYIIWIHERLDLIEPKIYIYKKNCIIKEIHWFDRLIEIKNGHDGAMTVGLRHTFNRDSLTNRSFLQSIMAHIPTGTLPGCSLGPNKPRCLTSLCSVREHAVRAAAHSSHLLRGTVKYSTNCGTCHKQMPLIV